MITIVLQCLFNISPETGKVLAGSLVTKCDCKQLNKDMCSLMGDSNCYRVSIAKRCRCV